MSTAVFRVDEMVGEDEGHTSDELMRDEDEGVDDKVGCGTRGYPWGPHPSLVGMRWWCLK